jgi:acetylornithine deacetylase
MPDDRSQDVIAMVTEKAEKYNFEVTSSQGQPFYISPETEIVQTGLKATGISKPSTVPFGTDAFSFQDSLQLVVLGPGNIEQAHTVGEYIEISQLFEAVKVYQQMIEILCM